MQKVVQVVHRNATAAVVRSFKTAAMAKQTAGVGKCNYEEGKRTTARGDELFSAKYLPAGEVKAVLVFHHGYGEHIGRYTKGTLKPWFAIYDARREYGRWCVGFALKGS